ATAPTARSCSSSVRSIGGRYCREPEVGFVDARAALDALGGVLDRHVGRTGALEDGAGLLGAVERVAYDSDEHVSARDLVLALGGLSLLEQTRAPGEPADERQSDDDRERAERS